MHDIHLYLICITYFWWKQHKTLGIKGPLAGAPVYGIKLVSRKGKDLSKVQVFVGYEAFMLPKYGIND